MIILFSHINIILEINKFGDMISSYKTLFSSFRILMQIVLEISKESVVVVICLWRNVCKCDNFKLKVFLKRVNPSLIAQWTVSILNTLKEGQIIYHIMEINCPERNLFYFLMDLSYFWPAKNGPTVWESTYLGLSFNIIPFFYYFYLFLFSFFFIKLMLGRWIRINIYIFG